MHAVEVVHEQDLGITLSAIAWLGPLAGFSNLHNDDVPMRDNSALVDVGDNRIQGYNKVHSRNDMALKLIEPRIHLAIVQLLRALADGFEQ